MDADHDLLLTRVFCTADDLLPDGQANAARRLTDAEVVTLCVAQAIMGIFASQSPGFQDSLLLIDSTPVPCAPSRELVRRSALGNVADHGYCASHSRCL